MSTNWIEIDRIEGEGYRRKALSMWMEHIGKDEVLSRHAKAMALVIGSHLNIKKAFCNPGVMRLRKLLGCRQESVPEWIEELVEAGYLQVTMRPPAPGQPARWFIPIVPDSTDGNGIAQQQMIARMFRLNGLTYNPGYKKHARKSHLRTTGRHYYWNIGRALVHARLAGIKFPLDYDLKNRALFGGFQALIEARSDAALENEIGPAVKQFKYVDLANIGALAVERGWCRQAHMDACIRSAIDDRRVEFPSNFELVFGTDDLGHVQQVRQLMAAEVQNEGGS